MSSPFRIYLLDTNTASYLSSSRYPAVVERAAYLERRAALRISVITEAELHFGAARVRSDRLLRLIDGLVQRIPALPWESSAAESYGTLRAEMVRKGNALATMDMLIAAHALALGATLVTHDRAFLQVPGLRVEDWMIDPIVPVPNAVA